MTGRTFRVSGRKPRMVHMGREEECFRTHEKYVAFYCIPYGKPPKGKKRYQAPEPLTSTEPMDVEEGGSTPSTSSADQMPSTSSRARVKLISVATRDDVKGRACIQPDKFEGSSDCLYLNIYLPTDPDLIEKPLPVLVFIHGGGFTRGSNNPETFSPEDIVKHELVFVTINYRLGPSGFLNLRRKDVPGNAGLKDQVLALEWIRDNIACFKGNPKNVTISGVSAGATCVNCHLVSAVSKDLFHRAIVQSGGLFWLWGYRGHRFEQKYLFEDDPEMKKLLFDEEKEQEMEQYSREILTSDRRKRHRYLLSPFFGPTEEKIKEGAFLPDGIEKMMNRVRRSKPVMAGISKNEALEFLITYHDEIDLEFMIKDDQGFCEFLMDNLRWSAETASRHADRIRDEYFPGISELSWDDLHECAATFLHDIFVRNFYDCFKFGPERTIQKDFFVYRFDHVSQISLTKIYNDKCPYQAATHGDDVLYLYCPTKLKERYQASIYEGPFQNREIREVMDHMCSLWANFCRNGTPKSEFDSSVEWKPYTEEEPYYLSIDSTLVLKDGSILTEKCDRLNELVNLQPTVPSIETTPDEERKPEI